MNPVGSAKASTKSIWHEVKQHPVGMLLFGMVFAAFVFPIVARFLGTLRAKGGMWEKVIPAKFSA